MNKIFTIIVLLAIVSCTKTPTNTGGNNSGTTGNTGTTSTLGNVTFQVYQKCPGFASVTKNAATISLYNSQSDLNSNIFLYRQYTQGQGTTTFSNLTAKTYYYKVQGQINSGNCNFIANDITGSILITANNTITKTITLQ